MWEGLGAGVGFALLTMGEQAGCREARLRTTTDRLAAIPLYLQLGFEPRVSDEPQREVGELLTRLVSGKVANFLFISYSTVQNIWAMQPACGRSGWVMLAE